MFLTGIISIEFIASVLFKHNRNDINVVVFIVAAVYIPGPKRRPEFIAKSPSSADITSGKPFLHGHGGKHRGSLTESWPALDGSTAWCLSQWCCSCSHLQWSWRHFPSRTSKPWICSLPERIQLSRKQRWLKYLTRWKWLRPPHQIRMQKSKLCLKHSLRQTTMFMPFIMLGMETQSLMGNTSTGTTHNCHTGTIKLLRCIHKEDTAHLMISDQTFTLR